MTNEVAVAIIAGCAIVISALITTIGLIVIAKLNNIRKDVNGRMTEMLEIAKKKANAQGNLEGRKEQTAERKEEHDNPTE